MLQIELDCLCLCVEQLEPLSADVLKQRPNENAVSSIEKVLENHSESFRSSRRVIYLRVKYCSRFSTSHSGRLQGKRTLKYKGCMILLDQYQDLADNGFKCKYRPDMNNYADKRNTLTSKEF